MSHYLIQAPFASMTFVGVVKSDGDTYCLLCAPNGSPLFRLPKAWVSKSSPEATAQRIVADRQAEMAGRN